MSPILFALLLAAASASDADTWHRFRGPNGTGVSSGTGTPVELDPGRNLVWTTPVPAGHSSPVVGKRSVFLTGYKGDKLLVIAIDRKTGRIQWEREVPRRTENKLQKPKNAASPSPFLNNRLYWE